ncbi:T-complex protein 1 subunit epsilon [Zea mays]|uniref:T-complex protein 1 subunit epsilon n=1 Tax=Zea mays TaxID=4577 RepID=A0A1D6M0H2_MAIZE|nr:T-complex protein 1 subunit epsilon [Zea mays]
MVRSIPTLCIPCHRSTATQLTFPCLILQVGAVQLQLLPDRGVAGDLHLLLHQDAVPGNPQRPHRIPWFLLESCQDR